MEHSDAEETLKSTSERKCTRHWLGNATVHTVERLEDRLAKRQSIVGSQTLNALKDSGGVNGRGMQREDLGDSEGSNLRPLQDLEVGSASYSVDKVMTPIPFLEDIQFVTLLERSFRQVESRARKTDVA